MTETRSLIESPITALRESLRILIREHAMPKKSFFELIEFHDSAVYRLFECCGWYVCIEILNR